MFCIDKSVETTFGCLKSRSSMDSTSGVFFLMGISDTGLVSSDSLKYLSCDNDTIYTNMNNIINIDIDFDDHLVCNDNYNNDNENNNNV